MRVADERVACLGWRGPLVPLAGGEDASVRVDNALLKPAGDDMEATNWTATLTDSVSRRRRVSRPSLAFAEVSP